MSGHFDEEKLQLMISQAVYSGIAKSLTNGLGAKVREVARIEAENIVQAYEQSSSKIAASRASAERWKMIAIMAVCSSVGGGGFAAAVMKYYLVPK